MQSLVTSKRVAVFHVSSLGAIYQTDLSAGPEAFTQLLSPSSSATFRDLQTTLMCKIGTVLEPVLPDKHGTLKQALKVEHAGSAFLVLMLYNHCDGGLENRGNPKFS